MPSAKMSGTELAGRLIALEAVVMAVATEIIATLDPDKAQKVLGVVKAVAQQRVDSMVPEFAPAPPMIKEIDQHATDYVESWVESIGREANKLRAQGAASVGGEEI